MGLDSLFQKTITPKERTIQQGDTFEGNAFKLGFEIVKF
jgi:hypothetical protein